MPRLLTTALAAGLILVGCAAPTQTAEADWPECRWYKQMTQELRAKYKELPVAFGSLPNGVQIQVFAHPRGKTFTIVLTDEQRRSCIIFAGEGWKQKRLFPFDPPA